MSPRKGIKMAEEAQNTKEALVENGQSISKSKRSSPRKPAVIKLKIPDAKPVEAKKEEVEKRPLKLTLKLSRSSESVPDTIKDAAKTTRITPKLTLSLRKPVAQEEGSKSAEALPKKRGRKPKGAVTLSASASSESVASATRKIISESLPASLTGSKSSIGSISASSLPAPPKPAVPVYSEEDRMQRQVITEMVQERLSRLQAHKNSWNNQVPSNAVDPVIESLWPFYEQLCSTEVTHSGLYRQAGMPRTAESAEDTQKRQTSEYEALLQRFNQLCMTDKSRIRPTELVLLEHRLCLEEERFLYTKLKNEYYSKYSSTTGAPR